MILMACACFPPEPIVAATLSHDLATKLSADYKVRVVTPKPSRPYGFDFKHEPDEGRKFEHIVLPSYTCPKFSLWGRMRESYSFGRHVSRYIRDHRADIQFVYICTWPLLAPFQIVRTAKKYSIPAVVHVEDIYPESLAIKFPFFGKLFLRMFLPVDTFILKTASKVIAVSENMKSRIIHTRGILPEKIALIHNWQDENEFIRHHECKKTHHAKTQNPKPFTFMYLGNVGPLAGVDFVIKSFEKAELGEARLIIAGSGAMKKRCLEIASGCKNTTILFWDVPAGQVAQTQDHADVMLLPVRRGGAMSSIPSKLPAYMFSKKPVIACVDDKSDTAKAVREAACGWITPPEDTGELVNVFQKVVKIPKADIQKLGMNGFQYAVENFSKKRNLHKLVQLITGSNKFHSPLVSATRQEVQSLK